MGYNSRLQERGVQREDVRSGYPLLFDLMKTCHTLTGLGEATYTKRKEDGRWRTYFRMS